MILLKLFFSAIMFPTIVGYITVSVIYKDDDLYPLEILGISYGVGIGIVSFMMFLMGWLLIPLKVEYIILACSLIYVFPLFFCIKNKRFLSLTNRNIKNRLMGLKYYEMLTIFMITIKIFFSYFQALIKPVQDIDSITYRMIEAKIFFIEKSLSLNQIHGYFIGPTQHRNYPLNISLFSSWIYSALGTWDDRLVKIIFPTFLLAMSIIFYYSVRRIAGRAASLFSAYLLLTLPFLIYHSSTTYIDAVVGYYCFSSLVFLLLFIKTGKLSHLILSSVLAGICTWTKNEGIFLIVNNLVVLSCFLLFKDKEKSIIKVSVIMKYIAGILIFMAPWNMFRFVYRANIAVPAEIPNILDLFKYADRIPIMLDFYYRKTLLYGNWNIAWFVLIVVTIIAIARRRFHLENMLVLFSIIFGMSAFGSVYCFSSNAWPGLLQGIIQDRNFLTFTSLVVYYSCISVFGKDKNILEESK